MIEMNCNPQLLKYKIMNYFQVDQTLELLMELADAKVESISRTISAQEDSICFKYRSEERWSHSRRQTLRLGLCLFTAVRSVDQRVMRER